MNRTKLVRIAVPVLALIVLVAASLACGSGTSATPQLVNTAPAPTKAAAEGQASPAPKVEQTTQAVPTKAPESVPTSTTASPQVFRVGDAVKIKDSVLMVLGWSELKPSEFSKPEAGNKFVAVDLLVVNASKSSASISSMLQASLKDDTGQKYTVDFTALTAAKKDSPDGELSPGERIRGTIAFQVSEQAKGLQFVFDASVFGIGKVFVDLGAEPTAVEPPDAMEGETAQTVYKIGEAVKAGDITLTVNSVKPVKEAEFTKPDAGNQFVVVDVTLENKGSTPQNLSSMLQMWLKDPTGQRYKVDFSATMAAKGTAPDGEIAAGEKLKGQVAFQVPQTAKGLQFVFDAEIFGAGKVTIALP